MLSKTKKPHGFSRSGVITTVTVGKRGTIVIPKAIRDQCRMAEGRQVDVSMENNVVVIAPSVQIRTRMARISTRCARC